MQNISDENLDADVAAIVENRQARAIRDTEDDKDPDIPEISTNPFDVDDDEDENQQMDVPRSRVVSGLGRVGTANLRLVADAFGGNKKLNSATNSDDFTRSTTLSLDHSEMTDEKPPETKSGFDSLRPSSKIRLFKGKPNLKMSSNINQVLPVEYPEPFEIVWSSINYKVRCLVRKSGALSPLKLGTKEILHNISGYFKSGEITAIMGPSGAGKSTLLEVLAGRKRAGILTGDVLVRHSKQVRVAYVPQDNYLMSGLTVHETLVFACKIQNLNLNDKEIQQRVFRVMEMFGLDLIRDTPTTRCSGGQQKRVSIASELFAKPNVLILDEPTTGLDSPSCSAVTKLLRELVDNPHQQIAVLATIHQPPWNVFTEFHQVYVLSREGQPIYLGSPTGLLTRLRDVGLPCGEHDSPADFIIEIAAGDHGDEAVEKLTKENLNFVINAPESPVNASALSDNDFKRLQDVRVMRKAPLRTSLPILMGRSWKIYRRNVGIHGIRFISIVAITIWLCLLFGRKVGVISACPLRKLELYAIPVEKLSNLFEESILMVSQNACALFFGLMMGLISGMVSTVLEFPKEMRIFNKEYNNGWYQGLGFYLTKSLLDIPMQLIIPSTYVGIMYFYTNQPRQYWRLGYLLYITIAVTFCAESVGAMSAAIFMEQPMAAAFVAAAIPLPMTMFGGLLVKYSRMPSYMQIASWTSLLKYAFEGIMLTMYGFDRCEFSYQAFLETQNVSAIEKPVWAQYMPMILNVIEPNSAEAGLGFDLNTPDPSEDQDEKFLKRIYSIAFSIQDSDSERTSSPENGTILDFNRSLILSYFELNSDSTLYVNMFVMAIYYLVLKLLTYGIILLKLRRS